MLFWSGVSYGTTSSGTGPPALGALLLLLLCTERPGSAFEHPSRNASTAVHELPPRSATGVGG